MRRHPFLMGVREFRLDFTTHYDYPQIETYDRGREWAHRLTLRLFETDPTMKLSWARRLTFQGLPAGLTFTQTP